MPYYFFTVVYIENVDVSFSEKRTHKKVGGVKYLDHSDIDKVWHHWELKYKAHFGANFISFDVVQISKRSNLYKEWALKKLRQ